MKVFLLIFTLIFFAPIAYAVDEVNLEFNENFQKHSVNLTKFEDQIENNEKYEPDIQDVEAIDIPLPPVPKADIFATPWTLQAEIQKSVLEKAKEFWDNQPERTDIVSPLLKEQLTKRLKKGPFQSVYARAVLQSNMDIIIPEKGKSASDFEINLVNILIDAKSRDGKDTYRIMFDTSHQNNRPFMQQIFQDLYYETKRIPHHSILIGNSRVGTGLEGTQSPYTLPFLQRSQISRNFSNIRKRGIRVRGDYKYADYDFGIYDSDTYFSEFMPGGEFNFWINAKPLAKFKDKYGKLLTGTGLSVGKRNSTQYFVSGAGIEYSYKKLWARTEYSIANGSNGATGLSNKDRQGWYFTLGYRLNKKFEILARYDEFDPNRDVHNDHIREYSTGINYYIKGQALKLVLNYIFRQNDTANNSHRILVGAQLAL